MPRSCRATHGLRPRSFPRAAGSGKTALAQSIAEQLREAEAAGGLAVLLRDEQPVAAEVVRIRRATPGAASRAGARLRRVGVDRQRTARASRSAGDARATSSNRDRLAARCVSERPSKPACVQRATSRAASARVERTLGDAARAGRTGLGAVWPGSMAIANAARSLAAVRRHEGQREASRAHGLSCALDCWRSATPDGSPSRVHATRSDATRLRPPACAADDGHERALPARRASGSVSSAGGRHRPAWRSMPSVRASTSRR